jgi:hypothetical protein
VDILASMESGFSTSNSVTTCYSNSKNREEVSSYGEFGISSLSYFSILFRGSARKENDARSSEETKSERKYTYGSLLNKLKTNLVQEKLLTEIKDRDRGIRGRFQILLR